MGRRHALREAALAAALLAALASPAATRAAGASPALSVPERGRVGEEIEVAGPGLADPVVAAQAEVRFFAGRGRAPIAVRPERVTARGVTVRVPRGALPGPLSVRTAAGETAAPGAFHPEYVLHLGPKAFAPGGEFGALEIWRCAIGLADGPERSVLRVSPGMAALGFRDLAFTFPHYTRGYDLGMGTAALRVRIPGGDAADPALALVSSRVDLRVAGPRLVLTAEFESAGPEFIGEYRVRSPYTGDVPWTRVMDVQADRLTVTATFPLEAGGLMPGIGEVDTAVAFDFGLTALGTVGVNAEGTPVKDYIAATVRDHLRAFFNDERFKEPLATAVGVYLVNNPAFSGVIPNRLALREAPDGGLEVQALTSYD